MNEVFDIKRLGKLLIYETVNFIPRFFKSLLIFASIIVAVWIYSVIIDYEIFSDGREALVSILFTLAIMLAPFIVYKDMNNRKKGYMYAMIPASTLEKLLSMTILCIIVVPVLTYAVLTATDLFLWLLSQAGIGFFKRMVFYNPFDVSSWGTMTLSHNSIYSMPLLDNFLSTIVPIFYVMMFNTIFRKNKVLKTMLFNMALGFVSLILIIPLSDNDFIVRVLGYFYDCFNSDEEFFYFWLVIWRIAALLFGALYLAITYFRIKKVNY